jgi:tripartite-type tricarboxylate transporter receptor subunit TctC
MAAGAAALPALSQVARAQAFPSRPVTMIVPFAPGGGTDVAARFVGEHMARWLPEFQASGWFAVFSPKATPKSILDKLTDALDRAPDDEGTRKRLLELANDVTEKSRRGQQALRALLRNEIARWTPIIQAANINAE